MESSFVESPVLRKNLERSLRKSLNKVEWFDSIRRERCSQDFYEFALSEANIPISWILEDLRLGRLQLTAKIREHLFGRLMTIEGEKLDDLQLRQALRYLTPYEKQKVLLSRSVLDELRTDFLDDETLNLLWEVKDQVSENVRIRWIQSITRSRQDEFPISSALLPWVLEGWRLGDEISSIRPSKGILSYEQWMNCLDYFEVQNSDSRSIAMVSFLPENLALKVSQLDIGAGISPGQLCDLFPRSSWALEVSGDLAFQKREIATAVRFWSLAIENEVSLGKERSIAEKIISAASELCDTDLESLRSHIIAALDISKKIAAAENLIELDLLGRLGLWPMVWERLKIFWKTANVFAREKIFSKLIEVSQHLGVVEETQRIFVDFVLESKNWTSLHQQIIDLLLTESSPFKLKFPRREFMDKAVRLYPLHPEILRFQARFDYRAALIWRCFDEPQLSKVADPILFGRRKFEFWKTTPAVMGLEIASALTHLFRNVDEILSKESYSPSLALEEMALKLSKLYGRKREIRIVKVANLKNLMFVDVPNQILAIDKEHPFVNDPHIQKALVCGLLQADHDFSSGLFNTHQLIERFFIGLFLSGAPIRKIIQFTVFLETESIQMEGLKTYSEGYPLLQALIAFYMSADFYEMAESSGIPLH